MSESSVRALRAAIEAFNREASRAAAEELPIVVRVASAAAQAARIELCRTRPPATGPAGGCGPAEACRDQVRLMTAAEEVNRTIRVAHSAGIVTTVTVGAGAAAETAAGSLTLAIDDENE
jgi:hypothetical protein